MTVATGILNIWMHTPEETAASFAALTNEHGRRFLLGIGVSHAPFIDRVKSAGTYREPLEQVREYLDGLDAAPTPVPPHDRVIAALGPKMLELAHHRTAGTHPYLVTPEHTATAREVLGAGPVVAVEQGVVLDTDADTARGLARQHLATYLALPNYSNNWKRIGFTDDDLADGGSDRLVDALWCGVTSRRSRRGWRSTTTPAPTTCACRWSSPTHAACRATSGGPSRPPSPDGLARSEDSAPRPGPGKAGRR